MVYDGAEDKDGFLWFATETGISRFDGTNFRNFTKADGLPDNEITRIFADSKNRIWMLPFHNSICYYKDGKIHTKDNDSLLKKLELNDHPQSIEEDKLGNILITTRNSFIFLRGNTFSELRTIKGYEFSSGRFGLDAAGHFTGILMLKKLPATVHILSLDAKGALHRWEEYTYRPASHLSMYFHQAFSIVRNEDSLLFKHTTVRDSIRVLIPEGFNGITGINDTLCTLNTSNGALLYNTKTARPLRHILKGHTINDVFCDSEGNWWFLTSGSGIFRIGSFEFTNYEITAGSSKALAIFSTFKVGHTLYAGCEKSTLFSIDLRNRAINTIPLRGATMNSKITSITAFTPQRLLLGTDEGIFEYFPPNGFKPQHFDVAIKGLRKLPKEVLATTHTGLVHVYEDMSVLDFNFGIRATCSYKLDSVYYFGATNGLYAASEHKYRWLGDQDPLLRNRITCLEAGPDSTLWIGTHGDGIIGYKNGKVVANIRQKDGLTSDICRNLFIAGDDTWTGTDRGLNRIRYENGKAGITTFTRADGLISDIVNTVFVDSNTVYVGTPSGMTLFDANKISHNSYCQLRITGILAAGRGLSLADSNFTLSPSGNAVRFAFVAISYRSAGDVTYQYRLAGLDEEWQTTRETFLNYPSLPAGDYKLQLTAINKFGVQSDMISIPFHVARNFWEKTWFRILSLIIIWALVWIFVSYRIKKIKRQNEEKMQISNRIADLEQMALKAQMNPHFIFNSLNSVQQYVIDKDILGANKFITEFSRLIRLTLDISSKTRISLYEEISYLSTYLELEKTKFEDKFSYRVELAPGLDSSAWYIPPMILQPYVENSIRHGVRNRPDKLGQILIAFRTDPNYLICCVEDNGVGRKKASQYKSELAIEYQSKGMTLTARRIEMLNKHHRSPVVIDIEDLENNHQPAGTRVTVMFPLHDAAER